MKNKRPLVKTALLGLVIAAFSTPAIAATGGGGAAGTATGTVGTGVSGTAGTSSTNTNGTATGDVNVTVPNGMNNNVTATPNGTTTNMTTPAPNGTTVPNTNGMPTNDVNRTIPTGAATNANVNLSAQNEYWSTHYALRPYFSKQISFATVAPAYQFGAQLYSQNVGKPFSGIDQTTLSAQWNQIRGNSTLTWDQAQPAVQDAYTHLYDSSVSAPAPGSVTPTP